LPLCGYCCQWVPCNRVPEVRRIEIAHIFDAVGWDVIEQLVCKVAVGVAKSDTITTLNHLNQDVSEEVGFS
jgi:hypothetical protein